MGKERETLKVRVDGYTRVCLTAIAVLLTVLIIGLWADYTPQAPQAQATKPFLDNSTQAEIVQLIRAQDRATAKIAELITLLKSGQVTVKVADDGKAAGGANGSTKTAKTTK